MSNLILILQRRLEVAVAVMKAQKDLVDVVHTLKQVVCVKG